MISRMQRVSEFNGLLFIPPVENILFQIRKSHMHTILNVWYSRVRLELLKWTCGIHVCLVVPFNEQDFGNVE